MNQVHLRPQEPEMRNEPTGRANHLTARSQMTSRRQFIRPIKPLSIAHKVRHGLRLPDGPGNASTAT